MEGGGSRRREENAGEGKNKGKRKGLRIFGFCRKERRERQGGRKARRKNGREERKERRKVGIQECSKRIMMKRGKKKVDRRKEGRGRYREGSEG